MVVCVVGEGGVGEVGGGGGGGGGERENARDKTCHRWACRMVQCV